MKPYIIILSLVFFSFSCSNKKTTLENSETITKVQEPSISIVSTEIYQEIVKQSDVQLVDVRTPEEYAEGSLPNAENIDFFDQENFITSFDKFDRDEPIYIYCQSGNRSGKSIPILVEMGFKKIYDLEDGYKQWVEDTESK